MLCVNTNRAKCTHTRAHNTPTVSKGEREEREIQTARESDRMVRGER